MRRKKPKKKYACKEETYHKKRTKVPLTNEEEARVITAARQLGTKFGVDVYQLIMVFLYTGMHPWVLYNLKDSRLRRIGDNLTWTRPKIVKYNNMITVPIHHKLKPWINEFIYTKFLQYRSWTWYIIKQVGLLAGIPDLSPMSLRHTFAAKLDDMGLTPAEIREILGCSERTVLRYTSRPQKQIENKMYATGWMDGKPKKVSLDENVNTKPLDEPSKNTKPEFNYHAHFDLDLLD